MPFRFSLQAVLRCRESFEHRERQRLEVITREVVKAQQQRDEAKLDRTNALDQLQKRLHQGMTSAYPVSSQLKLFSPAASGSPQLCRAWRRSSAPSQFRCRAGSGTR